MAESAQTTPEPTDQGESHGDKRTRSRDERASSRGERALHVACVATSSRCGHVDEWRQSLFCCCTASMEQSTDGAETAAIDGLIST